MSLRERGAAIEFIQDVLINADPSDTAGVMFDPAREPEWMTALTSSVPQTAGIQPGAEVKRTSTVGGVTVAWTTAVRQFHFPHRLHLAIGGGASGYIAYDVQRHGAAFEDGRLPADADSLPDWRASHAPGPRPFICGPEVWGPGRTTPGPGPH